MPGNRGLERLFVIVALACLPVVASAGPDVAPAAETPLEPVVVTATRDEERAFDSARSVEVVPRAALDEQNARTVPEALRESTGVFVQQTNFGGGSPIVRGMVGPQVLILVDGVRLNNSVYRTGPVQYLNLVDSFQVERLEVLRGPGSVVYGSDALGGVIQALMIAPIDRSGQDGAGWSSALGGRYGSAAHERSGHARFDAGLGAFGANVSASFRDFDDLAGGRGVGVQPYTSYRQLNVSARADYRLTAPALRGGRFTVAGYLARMFDVGRGEGLVPKHRATIYQNQDDLVYARAQLPVRALATDATLTVHYQHFDEDKLDRKFDDANVVQKGDSRDVVTVHTLGVDAQFATYLLGGHLSLGYGGEYVHDTVLSSKATRDPGTEWVTSEAPPYPDGASYDLGGAWLLATGELLPLTWDWRLGLSTGYRLQHMAGHAGARGGAPAFDFSSLAHVFQAGLEAGYASCWKGALTWSQGFRAPNMQESLLVGDTGDFYAIANTGLGPERADTFEVTTRVDAWRLFASAAGYVTLISDVIKRVPTTWQGQGEIDDNPVVMNANGGEGRVWGAEARLGTRLGRGLTLQGTLAWTRGDELQDAATRAADPLDRAMAPLSKIPPLFGTGSLRWEGHLGGALPAFVETYVQWAARQDRLSDLDELDVRIPAGGTPGWATWNLRGGLTLDRAVRLVLTLENLTDARYKYHVSGFYMPGTNALLAVDVTL